MCGKKLLRDIQGQSYDAEYIYIYMIQSCSNTTESKEWLFNRPLQKYHSTIRGDLYALHKRKWTS